jgi:enoyl-CoA hydratase/carnithine racemase
MTASSLVTLEELTPQIRRVTFTNPPFNVVNPEAITALHGVVDELSDDPQVRVAIFTSATPGYFFGHADLTEIDFFSTPTDPEVTPVWIDLAVKLSTAPFVSIASIRGRTRGGGSEFTLACDLRYASRENAVFSQPEVGTGLVPAGGTERLARLLGRDRALEVLLSSADYDADTAER